MGFESFIALCILSFTAAFTTGPNNALVAASGANFGFRRSECQDAQRDNALKSHLTTPFLLGEIRYQSIAFPGCAAFDPRRAQNIGASNPGP